MPKCKICGENVTNGEVMHGFCRREKAHTIMQIICDDYCKHVVLSADEEELEEECAKCKLSEILGCQ